MQKTPSAEATSERPRPAFRMRRRVGNSLAANSLTLSQCVWHCLYTEKHHGNEKRAQTERHDDRSGPLFFHIELSFWGKNEDITAA
jgi:hypothetical protein